MSAIVPLAELASFSSNGAVGAEWSQAQRTFRGAEVYWFATLVQTGSARDSARVRIAQQRAPFLYLIERTQRQIPDENSHCALMTPEH